LAPLRLEVDDFRDTSISRAAGVKFVFEPMESPVCWMVTVADLTATAW
jgi:hypothetical protein